MQPCPYASAVTRFGRLLISAAAVALAATACSQPVEETIEQSIEEINGATTTLLEDTAPLQVEAAPAEPAEVPSETETVTPDDEPANDVPASEVPPEVVTYEAVVVDTYPHDTTSFTQGLEFVDGLLLESTGLVGQSSIRIVEPETGETLISKPIDSIFGEGATVVDDEVWQLTWQDEVLIVHDLDDLSEVRRVSYEGDGWGLCDAGEYLIMTDGSSDLTIRDRESFEVLDRRAVTLDDIPVDALNELECVEGRVWANIWTSNIVVEIDPATGNVVGRVDLTALVPQSTLEDPNQVLNGIAFNDETGRFWLTGKQWPVMYELELNPLS